MTSDARRALLLERVKRVFGTAITVILRAGALAVAVTAVIVLVHEIFSSHHHLPSGAGFGKTTVAEEIPLEEYEADHEERADAAYSGLSTGRAPLPGYRLVAEQARPLRRVSGPTGHGGRTILTHVLTTSTSAAAGPSSSRLHAGVFLRAVNHLHHDYDSLVLDIALCED